MIPKELSDYPELMTKEEVAEVLRVKPITVARLKVLKKTSLGNIHLRYLKGLPGPYSVATADYDREAQRNYPGEALSREDYESKVEEFAGKCGCGRQYKFNALPRCPKCKSSDLKMGKALVCCD